MIKNKKLFFRYYIIYFLILFSVLSLILATFYYSDIRIEKTNLMSQESGIIEILKGRLSRELQFSITDLRIIKREVENHLLLQNSSGDMIAEELLDFSIERKTYDQIRYLDNFGMETVRVNFNEGDPYVVSDENLQNKSGRYYFDDAIILDENDIFISPLDLNIENGRVERPSDTTDVNSNIFKTIWRKDKEGYAKPMIRLATPVYNEQNEKKGIVLLNYFGNNLLNLIESMEKQSNSKLMFVNREGYWLKGPSFDMEWGFMVEHNKSISFQKYYAEEWRTITAKDSGSFTTEKGLFIFNTIYPIDEGIKTSTGSGEAFEESRKRLDAKEYYWKLISHIPNKQLASRARSNSRDYILLFIILVLFSLGVSYYSANLKFKEELNEKLLKENNEKLEQRNKELIRSNNLKDMFLDIIRHDIANPLQVIKGHTQLLDKGKKSKKSKTYKLILDDVKKIEDIIRNAKIYAKTQAGDDVKKEDINLKKVIKDSCESIHPLYKKSNLRLINNVKEDMPIKANPLISEVFTNLFSNALKYAKKGKKVEVVSERKEGNYVIKVIDYGEGILDKYKKSVFTRLTRLEKKGVKGTGLGLAIVKTMVEMHDGKVWVEDNPKGGAIFVVALPVAQKS